MRGEQDPALPRDRQAGAIAVAFGAEPGALVEEQVQHHRFSLRGRPRFGGSGGFTLTPRRASASRSSTSIWALALRSEEHPSELQSLMRTSYAVFCFKKKKITQSKSSEAIADI